MNQSLKNKIRKCVENAARYDFTEMRYEDIEKLIDKQTNKIVFIINEILTEQKWDY